MQLTGGQALAQALVRNEVETVFGLPGVQLDWAFDALWEVRDRVRVIHTRHEQGAAYMADGYARSSGKPGVCLVVPGPGLLNASAALATAYACSSPVLAIVGQIDSRAIGHDFGFLHEIPHQENVLASVTKWHARALSVADIPRLVDEAFRQLRSGRPRPVALEIPVNVLEQRADVDLSPLPEGSPEQEIDEAAIDEASRLLWTAHRPVIYTGGGTLASGAWEDLRQLALAHLVAPVVMTVDGRGALSDREDLAHTGVSGARLLREADVVLAVGTRFWQPTRVWGLRPDVKVIRIDSDPAEINRHGEPTVGIVADAKQGLQLIWDQLAPSIHSSWPLRELRSLKEQAAEQLRAFQPQWDFIQAIRSSVPDDTIFVNDLTQMTFYATVALPVYEPRTFIGPGYQGTLGSAYATALGAQAAFPERTVLALAGDGGFLYAANELATQQLHNLPVISVVFNDGAFGNVKRTQQQQFGGRMLGADLANPDFVRFAESFGVRGMRVKEPGELGAALKEALAAHTGALIEVQVGGLPNVWPVIGPAGGIYPVMLPR